MSYCTFDVGIVGNHRLVYMFERDDDYNMVLYVKEYYRVLCKIQSNIPHIETTIIAAWYCYEINGL